MGVHSFHMIDDFISKLRGTLISLSSCRRGGRYAKSGFSERLEMGPIVSRSRSGLSISTFLKNVGVNSAVMIVTSLIKRNLF